MEFKCLNTTTQRDILLQESSFSVQRNFQSWKKTRIKLNLSDFILDFQEALLLMKDDQAYCLELDFQEIQQKDFGLLEDKLKILESSMKKVESIKLIFCQEQFKIIPIIKQILGYMLLNNYLDSFSIQLQLNQMSFFKQGKLMHFLIDSFFPVVVLNFSYQFLIMFQKLINSPLCFDFTLIDSSSKQNSSSNQQKQILELVKDTKTIISIFSQPIKIFQFKFFNFQFILEENSTKYSRFLQCSIPKILYDQIVQSLTMISQSIAFSNFQSKYSSFQQGGKIRKAIKRDGQFSKSKKCLIKKQFESSKTVHSQQKERELIKKDENEVILIEDDEEVVVIEIQQEVKDLINNMIIHSLP